MWLSTPPGCGKKKSLTIAMLYGILVDGRILPWPGVGGGGRDTVLCQDVEFLKEGLKVGNARIEFWTPISFAISHEGKQHIPNFVVLPGSLYAVSNVSQNKVK